MAKAKPLDMTTDLNSAHDISADGGYFVVHVFDRSNPHATISYNPKTKTSETVLDFLKEQPVFLRDDIALVYISRGKVQKQYAVFGRKNGTLYGAGLKWLTSDERARCHTIVNRILFQAKTYPEMLQYLRD